MIDKPSTIFFEQGIPGFENLRYFTFEYVEGDLPMRLMKSVENQEVNLLVTSPFYFYPEYEWELSETMKDELSIKTEADIEIWSIITVPEDPAKSTLNLLAPVVLNINAKIGMQLILHDSSYSSRTPLIRA